MCDPVQELSNAVHSVGEITGVNSVLRTIDKEILLPIDREIIQPVGKTVEGIGKAIEQDPITFMLQVAAAVTPGMQWAIPLISAGSVIAKGGSVEDAVKAGVVSYVAGKAGTAAGNYASRAVLDAGVELGFSESVSKVAAATAKGAAGGTAVAVVTGRDPLKAMLTGGISAAVPALLGEIPDFKEFATKNPASAKVIQSAAIAGLTGRDVNQAVIGSLVASSAVAMNAVLAFDPKNGTPDAKMTPEQTALATDMLMGTLTSTLTGGKPSQAIQGALMRAGEKALGKMIDDKLFTKDSAEATKAYKQTEEEGKKTAAAREAYTIAATKYNAELGEFNALSTRYNDPAYVDELSKTFWSKEPDRAKMSQRALNDPAYAASAEFKEMDAARLREMTTIDTLAGLRRAGPSAPYASLNAEVAAFQKNPTTQAAKDALEEKIRISNFYTDKISTDIKQRAAAINTQAQIVKGINETAQSQVSEYEKSFNNFAGIAAKLTTDMEPTFKMVNQLTVEAVDPGFKPEEYRTIAGLKADDDPYAYFLTEGQFKKTPTNLKDAQAEIASQRTRLVSEALTSQGLSFATADPKEVTKLLDEVGAYGNNLQSLKAASAQDVLKGRTIPRDGMFRVDVTAPKNYGAWNKPPENEFAVPAGMKLADAIAFKSGTAQQVVTINGDHAWVVPDTATAPRMWNPETGEYGAIPEEIVITAPRVTEADKLVVYSQDPSVWEQYVSKPTLAGAQKIMEIAKETGNSTIINTTANLMKAGGGFLESVGSVAILAGAAPKDNSFVKFASALEAVGKAGTTAEYQKAIGEVKAIIGDGKGVGGTLAAIYKGFTHAPVEFVAEYLGVEGMQQIAPYLLGGAVGVGVKATLTAANFGMKIATAIGTTAKLSTGVISDIAESAGGAAKSAYEDAYNTAIKVGKTPEEAHTMAMTLAQQAGIFSGAVTAATMGVGGAALTKALTGKNSPNMAGAWERLGTFAKTGGKITIKEGVTEAGEEGLTQAFIESQLHKVDSTRDVAGNITGAAAFGAIAGGPIAGTAYAAGGTGDVISNLLLTNPNVATAMSTATSAAEAEAKLRSMGITSKDTVSNILNTKHDADYTSSAEAASALAKRPDFAASSEDVTALTGATSNSQLNTIIEQYVDPRVVDIEEVKAAAAAEGYQMSNEEAAKYIGQKDEASAISQIAAQSDPLSMTEAEAREYLLSKGYNPTDAEVQRFVFEASTLGGVGSEKIKQNEIDAYVNPRQVTEEEARKYLTEQGYTATDAEVAQFVGQVNEAEQAGKIGQYTDTRMVTEAEAKAAYDVLGLKKPTQEDVLKLVGQYDQTTLGGKAAANLDAARYNSLVSQLDALAVGADPATIAAVNEVKKDLNSQITALGGDIAKLSAGVSQQVTGVSGQVTNLSADVQAKYDTMTAQQKADVKALTDQGVALNTAIGNVAGQVTNLAADVQAKYDTMTAQQKADVAALTKQGVDLNTAIGNVAGQVTALSADVQAKYDTMTAQQKADVKALTDQGVALNTAIGNVAGQVTDLSTTIGRPGIQATQTDLDAVISLLESQGAYDPSLDYDGNKKIDQADRVALERALRQQPGQNIDQDFVFQPAAASKWGPTGLFASQVSEADRVIAAQAAEAEKVRRAQEDQSKLTREAQARQANLTRQAQQASALRTQRMGNINTMQGMLTQAPDVSGQRVTATTPDPAKIGYMYDWSSIFANPSQEKMFVSPYAQGGAVRSNTDDVNDELLNILRG